MTIQATNITRQTCVNLYRFNEALLKVNARSIYFEYVREYNLNNPTKTWGDLLEQLQVLFITAREDYAQFEADMDEMAEVRMQAIEDYHHSIYFDAMWQTHPDRLT